MRGDWKATETGRHLSGRTSRDTLPEVVLRRALHRLGYRFRLQRRLGSRGTVDIVLPRHRVAVFVDGCFWHSCPRHGPAPTAFRGPNSELWKDKLAATRERDRRFTEELTSAGWNVVRLWECEIKTDTAEAVRRVERAFTPSAGRVSLDG